MGQKITIGGDRLGSGAGMQTELNDYGRSTHNLTERFASTLAPGVLVPFYTNIAVNGDTFDVDLTSKLLTIPTKGPLMGTFKLQLDMFCIPIRLYNAILHNNPLDIGLNMKHVKLPKIQLEHVDDANPTLPNYENSQIAPTALLKYLGISGLGHDATYGSGYHPITPSPIIRKFFGGFVLGYWDTFKNYYANKQEKNAYCIASKIKLMPSGYFMSVEGQGIYPLGGGGETLALRNVESFVVQNNNAGSTIRTYIQLGGNATKNDIIITYELDDDNEIAYTTEQIGNKLVLKWAASEVGAYIIKIKDIKTPIIHLESFALKNIDSVRMNILSKNRIDNNEYVIDQAAPSPYSLLCEVDDKGHTLSSYPMHGLAVKTYQSDIFNNWLDSELIDGDNGIAAITAIDTTDGLKMDALLLAKKVYNMLNKIVAHGNTYEDWQEAVYSQKVVRRAETPIYMGGLSSEVVFNEVVASADTANTELGSLAGKGGLVGRKGGNMVIKVNEPSMILGIASITPRLNYSQGNAWFNTELDSVDDLHKPELDGIGYQNLMGEQMAWWATNLNVDAVGMQRDVIGKIPAWLNYMTAIDKVYGEFADNQKCGYMVLKRDYDVEVENVEGHVFGETHTHIADATTYIDPTKYNYAFAYDQLDAQNFWLQIETHVIARRVMSAKMIPNL